MKSQPILFIHGAHVNAKSWDRFIPFFEAKGYTCLAPSWPHADRPVPDLRDSPNPEVGKLGIAEIIAHYTQIIRGLESLPILIGHSFGGLFVQLLLDQGLGAAGVALNPAPPKGVFPTPAAIKANLAPLIAPLQGKSVVQLTEEEFGTFFANGIPAAERAQAYQSYVIPTPARIFVQAATAPFHGLTEIDYRRTSRAPLLITGGGADQQVPLGLNRTNYQRYRTSPQARVEFKEFPARSHTLMMEPGWEEVAEAVAAWLN